jgi:hypothetical protein
MSPVAGENGLWEITLIPATYYNLTAVEHPYWIAAVFRNSAGTSKGTGNPGKSKMALSLQTLISSSKTNLRFLLKKQRTNRSLCCSRIQPTISFKSTVFKELHNCKFTICSVNWCSTKPFKKTKASQSTTLPAGLFTYTFIQENRMSSGRWVKK